MSPSHESWLAALADVTLPLREGDNQLVVRSEVTEPFGWAFWMRLVDE